MPKGTATGNLDTHRPIALGWQDMRLLMTPLMPRFTANLAVPGHAGLDGGSTGVPGTAQTVAGARGE